MSVAPTATVDPAKTLDQAIAALNARSAELPIGEVERALRVAPRDARLWHVKGLMHRERDEREAAIPALRKAVELAPAEPLIAHGYAQTLLEAGLPSVDAFATAMRLAPNKPEVVRGMVAALVAEGRVAEAIEGMAMAVQRSPLWTEGHTVLAKLRWSEGEREGFDRSFDEAIAANPTSLDLRREQLIVLMHAEQHEQALARVDQGRAAIGDHPLFAGYEAFVRSEAGDIAGGDALFARLPEGTVPEIDMRRVRHLLRSGRAHEASQLLDHWLQTPHQEAFWHYAATAWRLTGDSRAEWLEGDDRLVGAYDISDRLPPIDELVGALRPLHTARAQPFAQSVRGGTQTDGNLFQRIDPPIVALREAVRATVAEHAAQLPPPDPAHPLLRSRPDRIRFSGAWSVRLVSGGTHANHVHPMGWLSSALYLVLPPDIGTGERAGWLSLGEPQAQLGIDLAPSRMIEPKVGRLALFPSWMWHGTRAFHEGERITVAFDVAR